MSRSIHLRGARAAITAAAAVLFLILFSPAARAQDSASIVAGTFFQGTVKVSLTGGAYANQNVNLGAWPLNTGGTQSDTSAISYENPDYDTNSFGGNSNVVAFGNGGGMTLQFATPITPHAGEKDLGIFTAQAITGGSGSFFNGNMEAAILVSADGVNWYTLNGTYVASPTTYTANASSLNAPTMAYNFGTGAAAWTDGLGVPTTTLNALTVASYTTAMPNDNLFNGTGTNAQRLALTSDSSAADYAAVFGTSGGGNWFDLSGSGLSQVEYVQLNGDANDPSTGGVRLEGVFANGNAVVPEPASLALLGMGVVVSLAHRRRIRGVASGVTAKK